MVVKRYIVYGTNIGTGRRKKCEVSAVSVDEAKKAAIQNGLIPPFEVTEKPPDPPSDRQIEYATNLGAVIPAGASKQDLTMVIQNKLEGDSSPPGQDLIDYANLLRLIFPAHTGKKALYNLVFRNLYEKDRIAFFTFCIYRWLSDDRRGNLATHPDRQKFYDFANQVADNLLVVRSIDKYTGEQLRFFGKLSTSGGDEMQGGSINTPAYKAAAAYIGAVFKIDINRKSYSFKREPQRAPANYRPVSAHDGIMALRQGGCFKTVLCLLLIVCLAALVLR